MRRGGGVRREGGDEKVMKSSFLEGGTEMVQTLFPGLCLFSVVFHVQTQSGKVNPPKAFGQGLGTRLQALFYTLLFSTSIWRRRSIVNYHSHLLQATSTSGCSVHGAVPFSMCVRTSMVRWSLLWSPTLTF